MGFADLMAGVDRVSRSILGGPVTYTPGVGGPVVVNGIFDASYRRVDVTIPGVSSSGPAVFLTLSDLPSDPQTDTTCVVTVNGTDYTAHEVEKDGLGAVLLLLHLRT